jgi:hypothetical protein
VGQPYTEKALTDEKQYLNIVEVVVGSDPLDVELGRRIMLFHKSRNIEPRHGRIITRSNQIHFRWCFSELTTARQFLEQFGGALVESVCE